MINFAKVIIFNAGMKTIYDKESLPGVRVLVARIESYDHEYLKENSLVISEEKPNGLKRKAQSHFVRKLLCDALEDEYVQVRVDQFGKPYLENGKYEISFSHTQDMVAVALSKAGRTGIDIEAPRDKVEQIAHKFMSEQEMQGLSVSTPKADSLTWYWSAKEAMYKLHGRRVLDYKRHLHVSPFNIGASDNFLCKIEKEKELIHCMGFSEKVEEYCLVVVVER